MYCQKQIAIMTQDIKKRSNHSQIFFKMGVLKNFVISTGKHLSWSVFLIKLQIKNRLQHKCFPVNNAKFSRTPFFREHFRWLLLRKRKIIFCATDMLTLLIPAEESRFGYFNFFLARFLKSCKNSRFFKCTH